MEFYFKKIKYCVIEKRFNNYLDLTVIYFYFLVIHLVNTNLNINRNHFITSDIYKRNRLI